MTKVGAHKKIIDYFNFFLEALASIMPCQKLFSLFLSSIYEEPNSFLGPKTTCAPEL
jgi:hypothetical protein